MTLLEQIAETIAKATNEAPYFISQALGLNLPITIYRWHVIKMGVTYFNDTHCNCEKECERLNNLVCSATGIKYYQSEVKRMITPEQIAANPSESSQQKALFAFAALNVNRYPELKWLFAIPNGGRRDAITGARMRAEGVKRGVPDILLPVRRNAWAGLWLELKIASGGKLSPEQAEWIAHLKSQGYAVMICKGYEEAKDCLIRYLEWK